MSNSIVSVKPVIYYPRKAEVGKTYLMTIDLQPEDGYDWQNNWHYEKEEYPVSCAVESELFESKSIGAPVVVIHCFGGSYGAAKFLLKAGIEAKHGKIEVALINAWGVTFRILEVDNIELVTSLISDSRTVYLPPTPAVKIPAFTPKTEPEIKNNPPKVFISYSHDSREHCDRVLALADRLRREGVDCNIDRYEQSPPKGWHLWMLDEIKTADFILVICTKEYQRRFLADESYGKGRWLTWEGGVIIQSLYKIGANNTKFIPVLFSDNDSRFIPTPFTSVTKYVVSPQHPDGYELLYRHITDQPATQRPGLGKIVKSPLLSRERQQFFSVKEPYNLPQRTYEKFIGRSVEINKLIRRISPEYRQHITEVIGINGIGKTALVVEVAYRCLEAKRNLDPISDRKNIPTFDAIIFTSSKATNLVGAKFIPRPEKESTILDIFRVIAETLDEPIITQVSENKQLEQVRMVLAKRCVLLIIDNMETLSKQESNKVISFLNNVPYPTKVIITTRESLGFNTTVISSLSQKESERLIKVQAQAKGVSFTNKQITQIYQRFGGTPIALIYAVAQRAARYSLDDILQPQSPLTGNIGKFCFDSSVIRLRNTSAYKLLIAMTFFNSSPCRNALTRVAGLVDGAEEVREGLAQLTRLSLITDEEDRYTMLPITREYVLDELDKYADPNFKIEARKQWLNWYLEFTKIYGGEDWENWRAKYDRLEEEWVNIELVLNWYEAQEDWGKVLEFWEQIDGYVDLNRYWEKRRYWWNLICKTTDRIEIKMKALSEKGWTSILMGTEHHAEAEKWLNQAWEMRKSISYLLIKKDAESASRKNKILTVQADVANHLVVLEKGRKNYDKAREWLAEEESILQTCQALPEREKIRHQIQNLYYQAEINQILGERSLAKEQFQKVLELCEQVKWDRFFNYTQNNLADILIEEMELEQAENILIGGLAVAETMRETRRIALYYFSYARLHYQLAKQAKQEELTELVNDHLTKAQEYIDRAIKVFEKEWMIVEVEQTTNLLVSIEDNFSNYL
jgi:hypothetical protein